MFATHTIYLINIVCRDSFESLSYPFLSVSLYNAHRELLESTQNMPAPIVRRPTYVWWGCSWDMQTPLEFLGEDCFILIELRNAPSLSAIRCLPTSPGTNVTDSPGCVGSGCVESPFKRLLSTKSTKKDTTEKNAEAKSHCVAWYIYPIHLTTINSESDTFELMRYPIHYPPLPGEEASVSDESSNQHATSDGSFLETSVVLSQPQHLQNGAAVGGCKCKDILCSYKMQPRWIHQHLPLPIHHHSLPENVIITGLPKMRVPNPVIDLSRLMGLQTVEQFRRMRIKECRAEARAQRQARADASKVQVDINTTASTAVEHTATLQSTEGDGDRNLSPAKQVLSSLRKLNQSISIATTGTPIRSETPLPLPDCATSAILQESGGAMPPNNDGSATKRTETKMTASQLNVEARLEKLRRSVSVSSMRQNTLPGSNGISPCPLRLPAGVAIESTLMQPVGQGGISAAVGAWDDESC